MWDSLETYRRFKSVLFYAQIILPCCLLLYLLSRPLHSAKSFRVFFFLVWGGGGVWVGNYLNYLTTPKTNNRITKDRPNLLDSNTATMGGNPSRLYCCSRYRIDHNESPWNAVTKTNRTANPFYCLIILSTCMCIQSRLKIPSQITCVPRLGMCYLDSWTQFVMVWAFAGNIDMV